MDETSNEVVIRTVSLIEAREYKKSTKCCQDGCRKRGQREGGNPEGWYGCPADSVPNMVLQVTNQQALDPAFIPRRLFQFSVHGIGVSREQCRRIKQAVLSMPGALDVKCGLFDALNYRFVRTGRDLTNIGGPRNEIQVPVFLEDRTTEQMRNVSEDQIDPYHYGFKIGLCITQDLITTPWQNVHEKILEIISMELFNGAPCRSGVGPAHGSSDQNRWPVIPVANYRDSNGNVNDADREEHLEALKDMPWDCRVEPGMSW